MLIQPTMELKDMIGKQVAMTTCTGAEIMATIKKINGDEIILEKVVRYLVDHQGNISPMKHTILAMEDDYWPVLTIYRHAIATWYEPHEEITKSYLSMTSGIQL